MTRFDRRSFMLGCAACAALMVAPRRAAAETVAPEAEPLFSGNWSQGGLIIGRAGPGARARMNDTAVRASEDGHFAFGFGRDHGPKATVAVAQDDGQRFEKSFDIAQREYRIQRIEGLPGNVVTPPDSAAERIKREGAMISAARAHDTHETWFAGGFDWPVKGTITGVYGSQRILNGNPRQPHFGVDIAKPEGTPIAAPQTGVVRLSEPDLYFTGGTVILDHGHGISTSYLHMSRIDVAVGARVERGERLGAIGMTGRATGPHLCWRLNWFQERLDPQLAAGEMPQSG